MHPARASLIGRLATVEEVAVTGADRGQLTLSDFGAVPPITAPADFVDLGG